MSNLDDSAVEAEAADSMNRDEIVRRFERWLDETLSAEDPPEGMDAELLATLSGDASDPHDEADGGSDSYALWSAVTALTQEVKLQGRAFKELHGALGTQTMRAAEELRAASREREREIQREVERRCRREILSALIDLRDALGRGLESVRTAAANIPKSQSYNWFTRLVRKPDAEAAAGTLSALTTGYELGLGRLDQVLEDFNVHEIVCRGARFDPKRMNAIDRAPSEDPEGTVLEVYRSGYEWNGEVFRPAQVKVSYAAERSTQTLQNSAQDDYE